MPPDHFTRKGIITLCTGFSRISLTHPKHHSLQRKKRMNNNESQHLIGHSQSTNDDYPFLYSSKHSFRDRVFIYVFVVGVFIAACILFSASLAFILSPYSPMNNNVVHFVVIGDWGREGQYNQTLVAQQMTQWCQQNGKCDFVVNVGDNFYDTGVIDIHDALFNKSFENIYTSKELKQIKWYSILGNHDYRSNIDAQVAYSNNSTRWYMPNPFFDVLYKSNKGLKIQMIYTDTSPYVQYYYADKKMNLTALEQNNLNKTRQDQWLEAQLTKYKKITKNSKNDENSVHWKFVMGHHPVYSAGQKHGDTKELIDKYVPLFNKNPVDAYFCGHDHSLQFLRNSTSGYSKPLYIISGGGSKTTPVGTHPMLLSGYGEAGFVAVTLSPTTMTLKSINLHGQLIYTVVVENS